jgi:hypothetical protein
MKIFDDVITGIYSAIVKAFSQLLQATLYKIVLNKQHIPFVNHLYCMNILQLIA